MPLHALSDPVNTWELREFSPLDTDLLAEIGRLRVQAWETHTAKASEMESWLDDFDPVARHWMISQEGKPVASARLSIHQKISEVPDAESYEGLFDEDLPFPIASLNRLVVHPSARGLGLSKRLDLIRLEVAEQMNCQSVIISTAAGHGRIQQLLGWGFTLVGEGPRFKNPPLCHMPPPSVLMRKMTFGQR